MNIKQWIINNIKDFHSSIRTEEDLKIKVKPRVESAF